MYLGDKVCEGQQIGLAPLHDWSKKALGEDGQPTGQGVEQKPEPACTAIT